MKNGQAPKTGSVSPDRLLPLTLSLPLRNELELHALLADLYNSASPQYQQYLTPAEFTARFGPTQQDYDAVVQWAKQNGFTVTQTVPSRRYVAVSGSAATISKAFHISLSKYRHPETGREFFAPESEPTFDLAVPLLAIGGLTDVHPKHPHYYKRSESETVISQMSGSGPNGTFLPSDLRAAYYGSGPLTGSGQTVAIFSYDGYIGSDLQLYYTSTGMVSNVPVKNVLVGGFNGQCFGFNTDGSINYNTCDDGEQILDIVNVIGMAPGLTQVLFYEGSSSTQVLNQIASDNTAKVISSSWGGGDFGAESDPIFEQFQAQGQTYVNATGDSGAFNSQTYAPPSVDPYITQAGGTDLTTNGAGGSWASETAWSRSGGGTYAGTAIPAYQQIAGVINSSNGGSATLRNSPDVSAEANFDNTTVVNGKFGCCYGGTSFAAPRWAGLIALANQQSALNGHSSVGFLNTTLYNTGAGANYRSNFHDLTSGSNPPLSGTGPTYSAVAGYDLVTGWGSPNGPALINTLVQPPANPFPVNTWVHVVNRNSGKCLDVYGGPSATQALAYLDQWDCWGGTNQTFEFTPVAGGYKITAQNSGLQLDVYGVSTSPGAQIIQYPYWGGGNEIWNVTPTSGGYFQITVSNDGFCMDAAGASTADGARVIQWPCWGGTNQQWSFQ